MSRLNYRHLHYFWAVAREGSVTRASEKLHVVQPTISTQLRQFEESLGGKLFVKNGRFLALTELGRVVFHFAEEIFAIGEDLVDTVKGGKGKGPLRLVVGVVDALPKLIAYRLIEPALRLETPVRVTTYEDKAERLMAELATQDLILSDVPASPGLKVVAYNHTLGETPVCVFGTETLAKKYRRGFPQSLRRAPFLLPTANTELRRSLDQWFKAQDIEPDIRGEFDDSALLKAFGSTGVGLFVAPSAIEAEVRRQYQVRLIGTIDAVREKFYAIVSERKLKNPAVNAILKSAGKRLSG
jgi:LysR family transcriptional activator of nhaA